MDPTCEVMLRAGKSFFIEMVGASKHPKTLQSVFVLFIFAFHDH